MSEISEAIERGVAYVDREVDASGAWPSHFFLPMGRRHVESPPFVVALGYLALEDCPHPAAKAVRARSVDYLRERMEPPGLWRYWPVLAPDLDDAAVCSIVGKRQPWGDEIRNLETFLSWRDDEGRFLTWRQLPDDPDSFVNPADSVVNANVVAFLGDRPETRAAQEWLRSLVLEPRPAREMALCYYPFPVNLYTALVRANQLRPELFDDLREPLAERILASREENGRFVDTLCAAQAITALDCLGAGDAPEAATLVEQVLAAQRDDGGFPECIAFVGYPGVTSFVSSALTTVCCVEALVRLGE